MFGVLSQWFLARGWELVPLSLSVWHGLFVSGPSEASNTGERVVVAQFPGLIHSQEAMALTTIWSIFKMEHLGLYCFISVIGNHRELCYQIDYGRLCVE